MVIKFSLTGHVDHGKSTLGGHLLYLCNYIDDREFEKITIEAERDKMFSFRWARILDADEKERDTGTTIGCSEIEFKYNGEDYLLIDTPGHKLYLPNLVDTVFEHSIDGNLIGVLVLSATETDSSINGGQVLDDITILRSSGISSLIVAINKLDKLEWTSEAFETTKNKIQPLLKKCKFKTTRFVPVSGLEGIGLVSGASLDNSNRIYPSLIEEIKGLSQNNVILEDQEYCKTNKIKANIYITNCKVLSAGYSGMLHSSMGKVMFEITKIEGRKIFMKNSDHGIVEMNLSQSHYLKLGERILIRSGDDTIAFGVIKDIVTKL